MNIIIERTIELNAPLLTEPLPGSLFTTESKAHQFLIGCTQSGLPVTLSGTVSAKFIREANNTTILMSGSISGGKASLILPADCYNISGRFDLTIFVTASNVTTCIYSATGSVKAAQDGTLVDEGTVVPSIEQLQQDITNLQNNKVNKTGDTMTGPLTTNGLTVDATEHPDVAFTQNGSVVGTLVFSTSTRRGNLREYASGASYYEQYYLPTPTSNPTANVGYPILTGKSPVTVAQGGTGDTGIVAGTLENVNSNITVQSETRLRRWGRVVNFSFYITLSASLTSYTPLFYFPTGFRPTEVYNTFLRTASSDTDAAIYKTYMNQNGAYICRAALPAGSYFGELTMLI